MTLRVKKADLTGFDEDKVALFGGSVPEPLAANVARSARGRSCAQVRHEGPTPGPPPRPSAERDVVTTPGKATGGPRVCAGMDARLGCCDDGLE